jgi:hypothetical protein
MKSTTFDIRGVDASFYETLTEWWKGHGWNPVALSVLPKCGVRIEDDDGTPLAAAFFYMENSGVGVGWMEWTVTNPSITPKKAYFAITMLTQAVREVALALDYGVVLTTARQESLVKVLCRNGFEVTDRNVTHMITLTRT